MNEISTSRTTEPSTAPKVWTPWRSIYAFGLVSLSADMVYEGMRSMAGPFLASLGASAFTVGLVTGAGEAVALVLRLGTGVWADRSDNHWRLTVLGYAMTAVCVPLLAVTPFIGAAGLAAASVLILLERTGKAIRSPAKSSLLARMAVRTGRGKGFAVHKALDQVGAFAGPLVLAGMAALTGAFWPGFAVLAIPGACALLLLAQLRRHAPIVAQPEQPEHDGSTPQAPASSAWRELVRAASGSDLPRAFQLFSLSAALTTAGLMTFGVISYRFLQEGLLPVAAVPLVYALAMGVEALAALGTGGLFDRYGGRVLLVVPLVVALVPACVFAPQLWLVLLGVVIWGAATGIQDSTVKAYVADLVPAGRRATAYGVFAAVQGIGALVGGAVAGALVEHHVGLLVAGIAVVQVAAFLLIWRTTRVRDSGLPIGAQP